MSKGRGNSGGKTVPCNMNAKQRGIPSGTLVRIKNKRGARIFHYPPPPRNRSTDSHNEQTPPAVALAQEVGFELQTTQSPKRDVNEIARGNTHAKRNKELEERQEREHLQLVICYSVLRSNIVRGYMVGKGTHVYRAKRRKKKYTGVLF